MAGPNGDGLRHVGDNPTGAGDVPVVRTGQVDNLYRPGGREHKPAGAGESPDVPEMSRPGGQEGGAVGAGAEEMFPRPGGQEGWRG